MIKRLYNYILHRRLHAEGVQRALTAPDKASQDSKPAMFAALALAELDKVRRRQIERVCPLDYLSVDTIRRCLQDCQLGAYAEQQWIWEQMERYDAMLMTCITKRDDALSKYDWSITVKPDLDDRDSLLAESQQRTITDLCNAIVNMDEAITALSQPPLQIPAALRRRRWPASAARRQLADVPRRLPWTLGIQPECPV